jgi:alpha-L-fucosidase
MTIKSIIIPVMLCLLASSCGNCSRKVPKVPAHLKGYEELYAHDPREAALQWFSDADYGLFIHFGLYALDGIGCRYQWGRALKPWWNFDPIPVNEYEKLMQRWEIKEFDADFIAELAVEAGMKYITITAKHCEGFCLWDSKSNYFNSMNAAAGRDVIGELAQACKERGLGFFPFYEIGYEARHPHAHPQGRIDYEKYTGKKEPYYAYGDTLDVRKYVDAVHEQVKELLEYDISGIWLDGYGVTRDKIELFRLQELYDMIHDAAPYLILSNKAGPTGTEDFMSPEGHIQAPGLNLNYDLNAAQGKKIEVCKSMAGGWSWHAREHFLPGESYAWPADRLWKELKLYKALDVNLLLNIGPRWDGGIEPEQVDVLLVVGKILHNEGSVSTEEKFTKDLLIE